MIFIIKGGESMFGKEPGFGVNNFDQAKYNNETETVAHGFLNLLFGKPGCFPSMPEWGINIQQYLYAFEDQFDIDQLKAKIASQCSAFAEYINDGTLDIIMSSYKNKPMLLIVLPLVVKNVKEHLAIGVTEDSNGNIVYNYTFAQDYE